jgi:hypothetical protein
MVLSQIQFSAIERAISTHCSLTGITTSTACGSGCQQTHDEVKALEKEGERAELNYMQKETVQLSRFRDRRPAPSVHAVCLLYVNYVHVRALSPHTYLHTILTCKRPMLPLWIPSRLTQFSVGRHSPPQNPKRKASKKTPTKRQESQTQTQDSEIQKKRNNQTKQSPGGYHRVHPYPNPPLSFAKRGRSKTGNSQKQRNARIAGKSIVRLLSPCRMTSRAGLGLPQ